MTRLSETEFLLVVPALTVHRDLDWLRRNLDADMFVVITDVTSAEAVFCIMGPGSRNLLGRVCPNDLSNAAHPFAAAREIEIGYGLARAHRISYVGELGWEIYLPTDQAAHICETLVEAGADIGLKLCGLHAMESCRLEKAYRHFGHDISSEDHVLEAGLGFAVKTGKGDFIGREAILEKKAAGLKRRLLQFQLCESDPLLYGNEPIVRDGEIVGFLTSGGYGHTLGAAVGLGYVPCSGETSKNLLASTYQIEVAGTRVAAKASFKPFYDPSAKRVHV